MTLEEILNQPTPDSEMINTLINKEFSLNSLSENHFGCKFTKSDGEITQWLKKQPKEDLASKIAALKQHLHTRKKAVFLAGPNITAVNHNSNEEFSFSNGVVLEDLGNLESKELYAHLFSTIKNIQPYPGIWSYLSLNFSSKNKEDYKVSERLTNDILNDTLACIQLTLWEQSCVQAVGSIDLSIYQFGFIEPFSPLLRLPYFEPRIGELTPIHLGQADTLLAQFSQLDSNIKDVIKLATSRLHQFYSNAPIVDRSISLRIAMEAVFCAHHEKDDKAKLIKLRTKEYILQEVKTSHPELDLSSKKIQRAMYDAYDITSSCVHTGQPPKEEKQLNLAANITKEAIKKYIRTGVSPLPLDLSLPNDE